MKSGVVGKAELFTRAQELAATGAWVQALEVWRQVIELNPKDPQAWVNLALTLARTGQAAEAVDALAEAFRLGLPEDEMWAKVGVVFCLREQYGTALENLERAVALNPRNTSAWANLVVACSRLGRVERAVVAAEHVLAAKPDDATTLSALGGICKDAGMPDEAIGWYRRALEAAPCNLRDISNLLWAMLHADAVTPQQILTEARRFDACVGVWAQPAAVPGGATPQKLRVGWVSADMRTHPVGFFVIPVLEQLARQGGLESVVYHNALAQDEMTQRARAAATHWRDIAGLGDAQVTDLVRQDGIDILVDLSGHTAGNRLTVFARRAAPVQVSWLGYPGSTGLAEMDYILIPPDPVLLAGEWCVETPMALPDCYCVREPSQVVSASEGGLPCEALGHITFGCLNNFKKVSPSTLDAWAQILNEVPTAYLVLVATGGDDQQLVADVHKRFAVLGVSSERLQVHGKMSYENYLKAYQAIDIALDPYPFNGGTTGMDSLCMGVPFITLQGEALHARMGGNLLRVLGLDALVAHDRDEYVRKAVTLAGSLEALKEVRSGLRSRIAASPLMDVERFSRGLAQVFRAMYTRQV